MDKRFDCIVVGGGHAGAEAASIVARGGGETLLVTLNLDEIAQMSCNPAIGGVAKGHIVREIDALGGIMGQVIDHTGIHFKMLNRSKGAAMWSPRAQADKALYRLKVKEMLEETPGLLIIQDAVSDIIMEDGSVTGVITERGNVFNAPYVILTAGTFLRGTIHIGDRQFSGGRAGARNSEELSPALTKAGIIFSRLKTGTPPRIDSRTIDFSVMTEQEPDHLPQMFSYRSEYGGELPPLGQLSCYTTHTTAGSKAIVEKNLNRSAMYGGFIQSVGPRYCPSIEDKVVRFSHKETHQIFLEPEGLSTREVYVNGISTSLPEDVQWELVHSITGLENAHIMRPGYAIEYDFAPPTQLYPWLETKAVQGLFFAGQINGTTGYEEAGAQGLIAGYNVLHKMKNLEPFVLRRDEAYTGVLIDDLVTKGVEEPYRMFTSRAEYRLHLRQDNADFRLMGYAKNLGINTETCALMEDRYRRYHAAVEEVKKTRIDSEIHKLIADHGVEIAKGSGLDSLFKRPSVEPALACAVFDQLLGEKRDQFSDEEKIKLAMSIKYEGYIEREKTKTRRRNEAAERKIPVDLDYSKVYGLKTEARQKLEKIRPASIGQALRISGVDPSDIDILLVHLYSLKNNV